MATFRSPAAQAAKIMQRLQGRDGPLRSVGTVRNYETALTRVAEWTQQERLSGGLRAMTPELAIRYLEQRGEAVGQKTLDMERQAMQAMMRHVTHALTADGRLPVIKSEHPQILQARAYTAPQVALIAAAQTPRHTLATEIAHAAGLRAHELLTLRPVAERSADPRPALDSKWQGRDGVHPPFRRGVGQTARRCVGALGFLPKPALFYQFRPYLSIQKSPARKKSPSQMGGRT